MPVVTARSAVVATVAAGIAVLPPWPPVWLWALNAALVAVWIVDLLATVDPRAVPVGRTVASTLRLDVPAELQWRIGWPAGQPALRLPGGARPLTVRLADELAPSLRADTRRPALLVPVGGEAHARTTLRPRRRGTFSPTRLTVRVHGPLGLAARQRTVPLRDTLRVLPAFPSRQAAESAVVRARLADVGERRAAGRSATGEFDALRAYTVDDEYRRIDWAATARTRAPVVRTYRAEQHQTVLILVDTGRTMAGRVGDVPRLDHALDAAMALTLVATRLGDRAGLVVFDESVRAVLPPRGKPDQVAVVSRTLADASPRLVESDYRSAFTTTVTRFRRRALLVVLTDLQPGAVEQTLFPALALVRRHHRVVVAGLGDPLVASWARRAPSEAATAFRAAAATRELAARARVGQQIESVGARVVAAEPATFAGAVADAYVRLKFSGGL